MNRTFADTVFRNGRIYTSNRAQPWAACAAVKAGRFIAVGEERDVAALVGEGTKTVDLGGRMAMPGIIDIHNHIMMGGQADLYELRFSNADSVPRIAETLHKAASVAAPGARGPDVPFGCSPKHLRECFNVLTEVWSGTARRKPRWIANATAEMSARSATACSTERKPLKIQAMSTSLNA